MSNDKYREEFEGWIKGQESYFGPASESLTRCDEDPDEYLCGAVHGAWLAYSEVRMNAAAPQPPAPCNHRGAITGQGNCMACGIQPPALVGEQVPRYDVHWNDQLVVQHHNGVLCKWEDVSKLQAENRRLRQFETALSEWADKTEWLRKSVEPKELGMHLADVMKERIDQLQALSVTNILMDVVPGDGNGLEVYAKSVREVVEALSSQYYALENVADERDQLQAQCDELEKDAGRYRWLRDTDRVGYEPDDEIIGHLVVGQAEGDDILWLDNLDHAIDAAMREHDTDVEPPEATQDCHDDDLGDGEAERMQRKAESYADDIPDFSPGNGNKAQRRAEELQSNDPPCTACLARGCNGECMENL
ncbi:hypothetical protein ALP05_02336 [Pseudomonas caricapapayae]|uniref:Uncharacterized protein n=1 Tax=Pseudomonas caricapapayae TaxID=46678 RepID=A0A3M6EQD3_9PSED|nr:hypothetical protein [Pseudomonas caricapapayae]RMV69996.1 hypothetical protein ALP05_02336 [Pseudomonas caricapapayae]